MTLEKIQNESPFLNNVILHSSQLSKLHTIEFRESFAELATKHTIGKEVELGMALAEKVAKQEYCVFESKEQAFRVGLLVAELYFNCLTRGINEKDTIKVMQHLEKVMGVPARCL